LYATRCDLTPSLLKCPLPPTSADEPVHKRLRLSSDNQERESIESRVESQAYSSFEALIHDVNLASASILEGLKDVAESKARSQILVFKQSLDKLLRKEVLRRSVVKNEDEKDSETLIPGTFDNDRHHDRGLVLTLTSVTEKGPKPLYSGLQAASKPKNLANTLESDSWGGFAPLDAKALPNGMTVIDPGMLHAHTKLKESKDPRTIGEVFQPHRSLKPLEAPQSLRSGMRDSKLEFIAWDSLATLDRATPTYKGDYKFSALPTGQWLQYHSTATAAQSDLETKKGEGDQEGAAENDQTKVKALFQAAYSSFAPTIDNSAAIIPEYTRSQFWWERAGRKRFRSLFTSVLYPEADLDGDTSKGTQEPCPEEFENVVRNFEVEESPFDERRDETATVEGRQRDTDDLLTEISELLETLSSYQRIRHLDSTPRAALEGPKVAPASASPSAAEYDTYEMLRSQLALLIDSLPPFAIAKLNGDQLEALNVGTRLVVENYDYPGTMEPDEQTLQRRRAAAAAVAAASRTTVAPGGRPGTYQTPSATTSYNRGAYSTSSARQPYQQPPRPAYGATSTPTQTYQTARPPSSSSQRPSYPQQYPPTTAPAYSQVPNVQQFQRPMQNGYGSYNGTPSQPSYAQRPTQPGYQQRAQEHAHSYGRSVSPQKPMTNGQQPYYSPRPSQAPQPSYSASRTNSASYSVSEQQAAIERAKLAQQQHLQRQSSGTPQTPTYGYDGATERRETTNGAPVAAGSA
jgi:hypothetical protein